MTDVTDDTYYQPVTDSKLPTPQRGQVWRNKITGDTYEVLDDRLIHGGWAVLVTYPNGARNVCNRNLHDGNFKPPRPEVPAFWVNIYPTRVSTLARDSTAADACATPTRICRVPLVPDWDGAVYDNETERTS